MTIMHVDFSGHLLTADEETELARRIEAGLYAEHLLDVGSAHPAADLHRIRQRAADAWALLWSRNLRLVMKLAMEYAQRHVLPVDDLFQEGCIGLGHAMRQFDHARGVRFGTLAHKYIRHAVGNSAAQRCGTVDGPLYRQRIRALIRNVDDGPVDMTDLRSRAQRAGVSETMAVVSHAQMVPLEDVPEEGVTVDGGFGSVEQTGTDFLALLDDRVATFLRLRFGIGCTALGIKDLARVLRMSPSTVRRLESHALEVARALLSQEQCILPARRGRMTQLVS